MTTAVSEIREQTPIGDVPSADEGGAEPDTAATRGCQIEAVGLSLRTRRGPVFCDIDLVVPAGGLAVITGPAGCGKTALLLTLAGRMRADSGSLLIDGRDVRRRPWTARARVGLAEIAGVNDLDESLSVRAQAQVEPGVRDGWSTVSSQLDRHGVVLAGTTRVGDLQASDRLLFGLALALSRSPAAVVVDDLHEDLTPAERRWVLERLRAVAEDGTTVIAGSLDPDVAGLADAVLFLPPADGGRDGSLPHVHQEDWS